jgi:S1-C subfamily serine protease
MDSDVAAEAIRLTIRSGDGRGRHVTVDDARVVLGRADDCDLIVPDPKASRRHAALDALPGGRASLVDLGSGNGTYVNGRRVESAVLEGHEQIQIGDTVLASSRGEAAGVTVTGDSPPPQTPSALHRLMVKRSLRRTKLASALAVGVATLLGVLLVTGVLGGGGGTEEAVQRLARAAGPSTVVVDAGAQGGGTESGTGWVLDAGRGLIVTNAHVVNGRDAFQVGVDGELRRASLLGVAPCEDLAVLRVEDSAGLRSLRLGRQSKLALGQTVVALGYPHDASLETNLTSTTGVVSVVRTTYRERVLDHPRFSNVIQTDAAINPGNSGGPLLDLDARLIGVTSAARTITPEGRIVQGQNYAIGVDRVREVTNVLRKGRSMGSTGAGFDYPAPKELGRRRQPHGLLIARAAHGTPADRAHLGGRGNLLVAINGQPIDNSLASYCDVVQGIRAGRPLTFSVLAPRASRPRQVRLALE